MFRKQILVDVAAASWPSYRVIPPQLDASGVHTIDLASAFLMLGTLTTPNFSPASPARYWAWVRYFLAAASNPDLRITIDFADLDPHQKGILSDDFGVAISTQWLFDRFGGMSEIIDGRSFMAQFFHLLPPRTKLRKAKVGPTKAPDFVLKDNRGRWHVLECKGTQSGRTQRNIYLRRALSQKRMIQINGALRGEQLAAGLALSNELDTIPTQMRIVDPDGEPLVSLGDSQSEEIDLAANRIAVARALWLIGLGEMAIELSIPAREIIGNPFLRPSETKRMRERADFRRYAQQTVKDRGLTPMRFRGNPYEGRHFEFNRVELGGSGIKNISVKQGVNRDLLRELAGAQPLPLEEALNARLDSYAKQATIQVQSHGYRTTITYGDVLFATLDLQQ